MCVIVASRCYKARVRACCKAKVVVTLSSPERAHALTHTDSLTCTLSRYVARTLGGTHQPQQSTQPGAAVTEEDWKRRACSGGRVRIGCNQHGAVIDYTRAENDHNSSWYRFPTTHARTGAGTRRVKIIDGRVATNVRSSYPTTPPPSSRTHKAPSPTDLPQPKTHQYQPEHPCLPTFSISDSGLCHLIRNLLRWLSNQLAGRAKEMPESV